MYTVTNQNGETSSLFNVITTDTLIRILIILAIALVIIRLIKIFIPWLSQRLSGNHFNHVDGVGCGSAPAPTRLAPIIRSHLTLGQTTLPDPAIAPKDYYKW